MKEILNDLLGLNLVLKMQKYGFQLQVTVSTDDGQHQASQLLPRDNHMDYALEPCIRFCINKILQTKKDENDL